MSAASTGHFAGKLLAWLIIGILAIVVLKVAFSLFRAVLGIGLFLLVVVGPIVLLGWIAVKAYRHLRSDPAY